MSSSWMLTSVIRVGPTTSQVTDDNPPPPEWSELNLKSEVYN